MKDSARRSAPPPVEVLESLLPFVTGLALAAPTLPGFTLCVPVLVLTAVAVLVPVVLVAVSAAILATPFLLIRLLVRRRSG